MTGWLARLGLVVLFAFVLVGAGCGDEEIDSGELEDNIRAGLEEELASQGRSETVDSVDCPDGEESETGNTFECTAAYSDGSSSTIEAEVTDGDDGDVRWNVVDGEASEGDPAAAERWAGTFDSTFGRLSLTAEGGQVSGNYSYCAGQLTGVATGNVLEGEWTEDPGACAPNERRGPDAESEGTFKLTLASDDRSFRGTWQYASGATDPADQWIGERITNAP